MTLSQFADVSVLGSINAIAASGTYLQLRAGMLSVATGTFMGIGALTSYRLVNTGTSLGVALFASVLVSAVAGAVVAISLSRLDGVFFAIGTLAIGELFRVGANGFPFAGGSLGLTDAKLLTDAWNTFPLLLTIVACILWQERGVFGLRADAIAADGLILSTVGINLTRTRVIMFSAGAAVIGLAGGLLIHDVGFQSPSSYGFEGGLEYLLYALLFGSSTVLQPVCSALLLTTLLETLRPLGDNRMVVFGALLVVAVVFAPNLTLRRVRSYAD